MPDPLFGFATDLADDANDATADATAAAADQDAARDAAHAQLVAANEQLSKQLGEATAALKAMNVGGPAPGPAEPAPTPQQVSADTLIRQFASDPKGLIAAVADGRIDEKVSAQLVPLLAPMIKATHQNLVSSERLRVDAEFGLGTFDELIQPALSKDVEQLSKVNQASLINSDTIRALVRRIEGESRIKLNEREVAVAASRKKSEADEANKFFAYLPPGMRPRGDKAATGATPDIKQFLGDMERGGGGKLDEKTFMAYHNSGNTIDDFVAATAALKKAN